MSRESTPSRERILERIRRAAAAVPAHDAEVPRGYERTGARSREETIMLFEERLRDYDAGVFRVRRDEIASLAAEVLARANRRRLVIPAGLPAAWRPAEDFAWVVDDNLSVDVLNAVDGVMTAATVGVAVSGSIALQHGPMEGRRILTLLPDYHLCVIEVTQIVETLPEGFARLDPARPVTFFSGPSATADIEMTRIKGVHGPRFLDVLIVEEKPGSNQFSRPGDGPEAAGDRRGSPLSRAARRCGGAGAGASHRAWLRRAGSRGGDPERGADRLSLCRRHRKQQGARDAVPGGGQDGLRLHREQCRRCSRVLLSPRRCGL
jgi:L-lactate dehydrogenase complex protein LldG